MKLLYVTSLSGQRINGFMRSAIIAAQALGIDFTIACNMDMADKKGYAEDCKQYGIKAEHIDFDRNPLGKKNYVLAKKQLYALMKREKYDVVHCNTPIGGVLGRICAKEAKVPYVIYQAHGFHFWNGAPLKNWALYYPVERVLAHYTDLLITINNEDFLRAKKFHLKKYGQVVKIPGVGVDTSKFDARFRFSEEGLKVRNELRKAWNIDDDAILFVSVGELNKNKNHEVVIRALAEIDSQKIYYIVCGEGDRRSHLVDLSEKLHVNDRVLLLGFQRRISDILAACDCFVLPSFREGLPGALMEAMASGIPCIASKIRGCTDLLETDEYLFDPNSVADLSILMKKIIQKDNWKQDTVKNVERVVNYDLEHATQSLTEIYRKILD